MHSYLETCDSRKLRYDKLMTETFATMLAAGGKANSLGRVEDVLAIVLQDQDRLEELYLCLFEDNAWLRMRAADALEKVCREHPTWLEPYIDRLAHDFSADTQPSIQWHMAQIYREVALTTKQKQMAALWLKQLVSTTDVDWIVAANALSTLVVFTKRGDFPKTDMITLLKTQQKHKSNSVVRRATKLLAELDT